MELVMGENKLLTDSITVLSTLIDDVEITFDEKGMYFQALDPAAVVYSTFNLEKSAFAKYEMEGTKKVGINLEKFGQILRRASITDNLIIKLHEENNSLAIQLSNDKVTRTFNLRLLDMAYVNKPDEEPNLDFKTKVKMSAKAFNKMIQDMAFISESVSINTTKDSLSVHSSSNTSEGDIVLSKDTIEIEYDGEDEIKSRYGADYLMKIALCDKFVDDVSFKYSNDYPMEITYNIPNKITLSFVLAPRVDS